MQLDYGPISAEPAATHAAASVAAALAAASEPSAVAATSALSRALRQLQERGTHVCSAGLGWNRNGSKSTLRRGPQLHRHPRLGLRRNQLEVLLCGDIRRRQEGVRLLEEYGSAVAVAAASRGARLAVPRFLLGLLGHEQTTPGHGVHGPLYVCRHVGRRRPRGALIPLKDQGHGNNKGAVRFSLTRAVDGSIIEYDPTGCVTSNDSGCAPHDWETVSVTGLFIDWFGVRTADAGDTLTLSYRIDTAGGNSHALFLEDIEWVASMAPPAPPPSSPPLPPSPPLSPPSSWGVRCSYWGPVVQGASPGPNIDGKKCASSLENCRAGCEGIGNCKAIIYRANPSNTCTGGDCYRLARTYNGRHQPNDKTAVVQNVMFHHSGGDEALAASVAATGAALHAAVAARADQLQRSATSPNPGLVRVRRPGGATTPGVKLL